MAHDQAYPGINCRVEAQRLHSEVAFVGERVAADLFAMVTKFIKGFDGCEEWRAASEATRLHSEGQLLFGNASCPTCS